MQEKAFPFMNRTFHSLTLTNAMLQAFLVCVLDKKENIQITHVLEPIDLVITTRQSTYLGFQVYKGLKGLNAVTRSLPHNILFGSGFNLVL